MDTLAVMLEKYGVTLDGRKSPIDIPVPRKRLAEILGEMQFNVGAEIGVEQGAFTEVLCAANPKLRLFAIDAWKHYRGYRDHVNQDKLDRFEAATRERVKRFPNCEVIKGESMEIVRDFPPGSLDFVYIDSNHAFDWVMEDIITWGRRVRSGGVMAGHDFIRREHVHVVQACQAYTYTHGITPWFTTGVEEETRGWFWIKP